MNNAISTHLQLVQQRINRACAAAGRSPDQVQLLAVSKTRACQEVLAALAAGQALFGENYVQEGVAKIQACNAGLATGGANLTAPKYAPQWHCIGPVQANKTRLVAEHFDWVQSIERLKIAQRLSAQRPAHLPPLQVCLQVNLDGGTNKSGVAPSDVFKLAQEVAALPNLVLRGFMFIPEPAIDFAASLALHQQAKALFDQVNAALALPQPLDTLSLGMSDDLEAAIHAGSTMVRVGTAIFGPRAQQIQEAPNV